MRRQPGVLYSEAGKCQGTFAVDLRRNEQIVVVFADGNSRVVHVFLRSPQLGSNSTRDLPEHLTCEVVVPTKPLDQLQVRDNETGSSWNIENGVAIDGTKKYSTTMSSFCFGLLLSMRDIQPTYPVLTGRSVVAVSYPPTRPETMSPIWLVVRGRSPSEAISLVR